MVLVGDRLQNLTKSFVWKEYIQGNCHKWFEVREEIGMNLRLRREISESQTKTTRHFKGPLSTYRRILNNLLQELQLHEIGDEFSGGHQFAPTPDDDLTQEHQHE